MSETAERGRGGGAEKAVQTTRVIVVSLLVGVLMFAAIVLWWWPVGSGLGFLVVPLALAGLVAPVIGYRAYHVFRERIPESADFPSRCERFQRATIVALSVTEGVAFLGIVVYMFSGDWASLIGVTTHVLLTGAIWPSRTRLDGFAERPSSEGSGG